MWNGALENKLREGLCGTIKEQDFLFFVVDS